MYLNLKCGSCGHSNRSLNRITTGGGLKLAWSVITALVDGSSQLRLWLFRLNKRMQQTKAVSTSLEWARLLCVRHHSYCFCCSCTLLHTGTVSLLLLVNNQMKYSWWVAKTVLDRSSRPCALCSVSAVYHFVQANPLPFTRTKCLIHVYCLHAQK